MSVILGFDFTEKPQAQTGSEHYGPCSSKSTSDQINDKSRTNDSPTSSAGMILYQVFFGHKVALFFFLLYLILF